MQQTKTIRVLIVDDHDMVRDGLGLILSTYDDLHLVGEAHNSECAIQLCEQEHPDVVLMDVYMPGKDGIATTREILDRFPETRIVILTSFDTNGLVEQAFKAGAISFLKKSVSRQELADAIRAAYIGKSTLSPEATQELIAITTRPPQPGHDLTNREWDVLRLLGRGLNNDEIATDLDISPSTVKHHVSSILRKFDANNRSEAVIIAMEHDLI